MRTIASVTFIWNHEPFIIPHFNMISNLDHNFVFIGDQPLHGYDQEHGISSIPDNSENIIREKFPHVQIIHHKYNGFFCSDLYNRVDQYFRDYNLVLRLDPDMFFIDKDWEQFTSFLRNSNSDCYRINFSKCSINYYMDWDHGLQDAQETDIMAYDPKKRLEGVLDYPAQNPYVINWNNWMMHHFRGWNKPRTVTKNWPNEDYAKVAFKYYSNNGDWFHVPDVIKAKFDPETADKWLKTLNT